MLTLFLQPDSKGEEGDVRDLIVVRSNIQWEIGLSLKHNHFAVKHSRLAKNLDFGSKWFNLPCSQEYWSEVKPIFDYLEVENRKKTYWRDLPNKDDDVYVPLLNAFANEIRRSAAINPHVPRMMTEYLIGKFDFYKVVSVDKEKTTHIFSYNLRGTLNQSSRKANPKVKIPTADLPTRIVSLDLKPSSKTTAELYMDAGWQFSFRIHNAESRVKPTLKFDIKIIGSPISIVKIDCKWN